MQQEITFQQAWEKIEKKMARLQENPFFENQEEEKIEGRQGILLKDGFLVHKFLHLVKDNPLTLKQLQVMNRTEFQHLQILASRDYTCQVQEDKCDNNDFLWIATAYMNQGNLDMDCIYTLDRHGILDFGTISIICNRLLQILNYFHQQRIFHLDVNPTNILLHEEFQFCYQQQGNHPELPIQQGLQQLRNNLRENQQQPFEQQVNSDYTNLQYILSLIFKPQQPVQFKPQQPVQFKPQQPVQFNPKQSYQLIKHKFTDKHVAELLYWIERWLSLQKKQTFNPEGINVKKGIRICFCDFGNSVQFEINDFQRPKFEDQPYRTPYKIFGEIVNQQQQIEAWRIARQQDLFCLGMTMMNLLTNNRYVQSEALNLDEQNLGNLANFIRQTYQLGNQNIPNISYDDKILLLQYQSYLIWLRANMEKSQTFRLIYHMLSFRFTSNDIELQDQEYQDIPLEIINNVSRYRKNCRKNQIL